MKRLFKQLVSIMLLVVFSTSCGCVTLFSSVNFKNAPRNSFVKVEVMTQEYDSTGSGVIIRQIENSNTIILTAGHMCKPNTIAMRVLDIKEEAFQIIGFIAAENDDLCLLITKGVINGDPVKIANNPPEIGDHAYNIAAPMGLHAPDMELMFDGYHQGKVKINEEKYPLDIYSIAGRGGSSGSPIFNNNWELIGIVSRGIDSFQHIMITVNQERVKAFYDYAYTPQFKVDAAKNMGNLKKKIIDFMKSITEDT